MDLTNRNSNRVYELIVGDYKKNDGLLINSLQITFDITKSSSNKDKSNSAAIEIYNLSDESLKLLDTDYPAASFSAGYKDTGDIKLLFGGQVTQVSTRPRGTDRVTQILMGTGYTELNHQVMSDLVAPGVNADKVLDKLVPAIGADRGVYNGTNLNSQIIYGYPLTGTPKEMLDEISEKYNVDWQLDDGVLYVHDNDKGNTDNLNTAYVISRFTGLVEAAYRVSGPIRRSKADKAKKPGIQMKIMLNSDIRAGDIIKLEDTLIQGWYKVDELRHTGGFRSPGWYTEIRASAVEKVIKS